MICKDLESKILKSQNQDLKIKNKLRTISSFRRSEKKKIQEFPEKKHRIIESIRK